MAIELEETRDSPKLAGKKLERRFIASGSELAGDVRVYVLANTAILDGYLVRQDVNVEPLDGALDLWDVKVTWAPPSEEDPSNTPGNRLPPTFRFSTSGGKSKMTVSYQVVASYPASDTSVDDYGGLIGSKSDGPPDGIEVEAPGFSWQETWYPRVTKLTWPYALKVRNLSACTNVAKFRAFDPGEVLFLYCEGGRTGKRDENDDEVGELTFHFASNPNATGLSVGTINNIDKKGWEYMEIKCRNVVLDGPPKRTVQQPYAVYIHRVFREGDFVQLGIGQ
jgi:hypothetical protein